MSRTMPPTPVVAPETLDRARMIMRFDLERDGDAVADVNDARVSSPAPTRISATWWEGLEQRLGVFVAAMLAPHHGKMPSSV